MRCQEWVVCACRGSKRCGSCRSAGGTSRTRSSRCVRAWGRRVHTLQSRALRRRLLGAWACGWSSIVRLARKIEIVGVCWRMPHLVLLRNTSLLPRSSSTGLRFAAARCMWAIGCCRSSSYYCICVLILPYICPHTLIYVSSYSYICCDSVCVGDRLLQVDGVSTSKMTPSYCYISSGLILLYVCPHTRKYVSFPAGRWREHEQNDAG